MKGDIVIKRLITIAGLLLAISLCGALAGSAAAADSPWGSNYFPNVPLVTQEGKTVRLYDDLLKGKRVLISFIFSNCEQGCPLDTANMARVQKLLGDRVGRDVFMYSITLDPENDTPEAMKEYAEQYHAAPGWLFLTGTRKDIDEVRYKFGDRGDKTEHANAVQVGDVDKGRWIRVPLNADPNYIALEIKNTLFPEWSRGKTLKSIAEAERSEVFGPGQLLYSSRCAACHTIGKGGNLGPDLMGITERRERNWLVNYLFTPDRMRAHKDPIALELAKSYKVLMPNLNLTHKDIDELIDYLQAMNVPAAKPEAPQAAAGREKPGALAHEDHQHHHVGENK